MYSPAVLPSRMRAAPAKNRIWSTIGGISSLRIRRDGFPEFSHLAVDDLLGAGLDGVGDAEQGERTLRRRRVAPRLERVGGRVHGVVDVLGPRQRAVAYSLTRHGIDDRHCGAVCGVDELAVDEVLEV